MKLIEIYVHEGNKRQCYTNFNQFKWMGLENLKHGRSIECQFNLKFNIYSYMTGGNHSRERENRMVTEVKTLWDNTHDNQH